jgi:hypothetical protein
MSTKRYTHSVTSEPKRKQFAIRMRSAIHEAGQKAAADENRSLASLMETLLIDHLKANGYLPVNGKSAAKKR